MNNILIATTNKGKLKEFALILKGVLQDANFITLGDLPSVKPPQEVFDTFLENAKLKADFYFKHFKMPVIVEDSGFCVEELNGLPGVHSATWGEGEDFTKGIQKVYDMLKGKPSKAFFTSTIIFKTSAREVISEGRIDGIIASEPKGQNGFGFDPCFIPNGFIKTFAQMTAEEKSSLSHRRRAIENLTHLI
jgi:XTP/dITP diphosphohydrolase